MTAESADNVKADLTTSLLEMKTFYEQLDSDFKTASRSSGINREWLENRYFYLQKIVGKALNEAIRAYKANDLNEVTTKLDFVSKRLEAIQSQLTAQLQPAPPATFEPVDTTRIVPGFDNEPPHDPPLPVRPSMERPPPQRGGHHRAGQRKVREEAPGVIARILRKINTARRAAVASKKAAQPRHRSH